MIQSITARSVAICSLVIALSVFAVVGVGTAAAESSTNETETPRIVDAGEGKDVFISENRTVLKDVSVKTNGPGARIFVSTKIVESKGIGTRSSAVTDYNITGGEVTSVDNFRHENHTVFEIKINSISNTKTLKIDRLNISDLDNSEVNSTIRPRYQLIVSGSESNKTYSQLLSENQLINSSSFEVVANSVKVQDQATISSRMLSESPTSNSITISKLVTYVDSVVLITQGYNGNRIAGYARQPATSTEGRQNISIKQNIIGGEKRIHVIPEDEIDLSSYDRGDNISDSKLSTTIATDSAYVYSGIISINNQSYRDSIESNLTISEVELLDTVGGDTPYVVSVHPITRNKKIAYDMVYGYSGKLVGRNKNVSVELGQNNANTELYTNNKLAAVLQLYNKNTESDDILSEAIVDLPNSDLDQGFVGTGVSDVATVTVEQKQKSNHRQIQIDRLYRENNSTPTIYSGTTIVNNNSTIPSGELVSIDGSRRVLSSVGYSTNSDESVKYKTKGLNSGEYILSKNGLTIGQRFSIVGPDAQYVRFNQVESLATNSSIIDFQIQHHTPTSRIRLISPDTNKTAATIELTTPEQGTTTLKLNTYVAATQSLTESITLDGANASVESIATPTENETLATGTYEVAVRSAQGIARTSDNATLTLTNRSTNRLTTYTGPETVRSDLGTATAVRDAIADGTLSKTERIDRTDTVVYAVNATGLTGLVNTRNTTLATGRDLDRLDGLEFGVRSAEHNDTESVGDALGETPRNATVHADRTGLYVVTDGDNAVATDEDPTPGAAFTATFRVTDDRLRAASSDTPGGHRVSSTVAFADTNESGESDGSNGSDSSGDKSERIAGGGPVGGGGGGSGGGTGGTGGTQGPTPTGQTGGKRSNNATAANASESGGADDGNASEPGIKFAPRPTTGGQSPFERGTNALTVPTITERSGPSEAPSDREPAVESEAPSSGNSKDGVAGATADQGGRTDQGAGVSARPTPTYENAPIRATAEDVPGFGLLQSVAALAVTLLTALRRRSSH